MAKRMRRIYRAKNGVVDGSDFWISDSAQPRRGKAKASSARKQEANRNQAAHILARKLNNNFEQGDLFLTLTWDGGAWQRLRSAAYRKLPRGAKEKTEVKRDAILFEAEREGKLFLRRLREAGASDMKYFIMASDMDGKTGDPARVHVHVILSGECFAMQGKKLYFEPSAGRTSNACPYEGGRQSAVPTAGNGRAMLAPTAGDGGRTLEDFWSFGKVDYEHLRGGSYSALAAYLIRQTRDIKNHKKYACSRNLEPIEYEEFELDANAEPLQAPAGAKVEEYQNDPTNPYGMVYLRYIEPETPKTGKRRRKNE